MAQNVGTLVSSAIRPNDSLDPIASAFAVEIKGGLHTTTTATDRNNIIFQRREWGMMCYVTNDNKTYQLTYGYAPGAAGTDIMNNSNWKEFSGAGGSGGGGGEWIDSVLSIQNSEPISPNNGDRYIVGQSPTGGVTWTSLTSDSVVQWNSSLSTWDITTPTDGMSVRVDNLDNIIYKYEGTFPLGAWQTEKLNSIRNVSFNTSTGLTYSAVSNPPFTSYNNEIIFLSTFNTTNSATAVSLDVNGLGLVSLLKASESGLAPLKIGDLIPGVMYSILYNGANFQISNPSNESLFNVKRYIESSDTITVPQYYQYWVYGDLEVAGNLINYGHVVVANGGLVLSGSGSVTNMPGSEFLILSLQSGATTSYNNSSTINFDTQNTIFGPSVSAYVKDGSLTASKLDTGSNGGATAGYLLSVDSTGDFVWTELDLSTGTTTIAIGPSEDGTYSDGIFTDFSPTTPIGTAVDRFNEMLLLLAPTPPSNWNNAISSISFTSPSWTARQLSSLSTVTIYTDTTPDLTSSNSVGNQASARVDTNGLTFSLFDNGLLVGTAALSGTYTVAKTSGRIRHGASVDPYTLPTPQAGKVGFWTGITSFALAESLPSITPSSSQRTLQLFHPGTDSPETFNYYIDSTLTVSIGTITATVPAMTSYISGVPTLTTSQTVTNISFPINNVASYFWAATSVYAINAGHIAGSTGDPDVVPTSYGETGNVTGKSGAIQSGQFSDLSFFFTVKGRNSIGTYGSDTTFTSTSHRIDTISNESSRRTSGAGSYPSSGYNGVYDSTQSLVGTYTEELQLRSGSYVYPTVNYTSVFGGPDYSSPGTGYRWATFVAGTVNGHNQFTLNIIGLSGVSAAINNPNFAVEIKVDGSVPTPFWMDGDATWDGSPTQHPGSISNGQGCVIPGSSTAASRRITFGQPSRTGNVIVRIGWNSSLPSVQFSSVSVTAQT